MNKVVKISAITLVTAAIGLTTVGAIADRGEYRGFCDGEGRQAMMHKMHKGGRFADRDLDLTAEQVKTLVEAKLIMSGNDRLKVGQITQKDDDTYVVDIVTVDDSLVRQIEIDRDQGLPRGPMGGKRFSQAY